MIRCWFDGGITVNPGGTATYGFIIEGEGEKIEESGIVGSGPAMSNNVAEFEAAYRMLKRLKDDGHLREPIVAHGDSQLVCKILMKVYPCGKGLYRNYALRALEMRDLFDDIFFQWIPREQNTRADQLSSDALMKRDLEAFELEERRRIEAFKGTVA